MQAELPRAGVYAGVVILSEDGTVTVDLEDPAEKEHVELGVPGSRTP